MESVVGIGEKTRYVVGKVGGDEEGFAQFFQFTVVGWGEVGGVEQGEAHGDNVVQVWG